MVGSIPNPDGGSVVGRVQGGLIVLVGLSAGLLAIQSGATAPVAGTLAVGGLVVGVILVRLVVPDSSDQRRR